MTPNSPDQLRWQLSPILCVALDADDRIVIETLGHRAAVPNPVLAAEALRQARSAQGGAPRDEDPILLAQLAAYAAQARHDAVREHITDAAARLLSQPGALDRSTGEIAGRVADGAMDDMGPLFCEAVTSAADFVVRQIVDHPDWGEVIRKRAAAEADAKTAELLAFVQDLAAMRKDGEPGDDGEPYDSSDGRAMDLLDGVVGQARALLGIQPEPEPLLSLPLMNGDAEPATEGDDQSARFRWNNHYRQGGAWCRWSLCAVSAAVASREDDRCPFDCPDSRTEPIPAGEAAKYE